MKNMKQQLVENVYENIISMVKMCKTRNTPVLDMASAYSIAKKLKKPA